MAGLPGKYAPPEGRLLLAQVDGESAGCVAFYKVEVGVCEIKRLWTRPQFRGQKIGRALVEALISEARQCGYTSMILSTADVLKEAQGLYGSLGFLNDRALFRRPAGDDGPRGLPASRSGRGRG
jgi:ribosomal protein S18 acetylase RimI-like enzyme